MPPLVSAKHCHPSLGAAAAALAVVLFCLHLLHGNPGVFFNDDYQISILPVFADVARSWSEGDWPVLSPYSWACGNLAGEYQYGTFSLFVNAVVVVIWKFSLTFAQQAAALSVTHLAVLAAGAYLLARARRLSAPLALGVAVIASLNGWEMGWGATDWFGALAAHAWLPWCWWAFEVAARGDRRPSRKAGRWRVLLPVPFVYLLLTGGFPYTVVMLGLVTMWLAARVIWTGTNRKRALWTLGAGWIFGLMLSAPAWLSLLEAVHGSGRSEHGVGTGNLAWTVPVASLPGFILPNWTTQWPDFANRPCTHGALELAGGFVPVVGMLAGMACLRGRGWRLIRWDMILLGTVLLLCLLPSPGLFRWSFRWLPLLHLVLALTGGRALQTLVSRTRRNVLTRNPGVWAVGIVGMTWLAMRIAHLSNPDPLTKELAPGTLAVAVVWAALAALPVRRSSRLWAAAVAVGGSLLVTYTFARTNTGLPIYPAEANLAEVSPLSPDRLYLSLYREPDQFYRAWQVPPGYGAVVRMGSMGMYAGVRMINGYSPIMSAGVGKEFGLETHGNVPEASAERLLSREAESDGLLARLGVDAIVITHDYQTPVRPPAEAWDLTRTFDEGDVYERSGDPLAVVRSWTSAEPGGSEVYAPVGIHSIHNGRQRAEAVVSAPPENGKALVAFSRPFYLGYKATLNGNPLPVGSFRGLLPTVEIPARQGGLLVLKYEPRALFYGWISVGLAALGLTALGGWFCLTKD